MNIDLTPQEAKFIFENLAQLTVPMNNPQAPLITQLGHSVLTKLQTAIEAEKPAEKIADLLDLDEPSDAAAA